jgi:protein-L-isoaspartate(D-aspartate) O-methyltransferase
MDCETLVNKLKDRGSIKSKQVEDAFLRVDRAVFVPEKYRMSAYEDRPLPIGEDATISAPHMVAINTELLDVKPDSKVVEIGSGSGYQAAIIAELAEKVVGIEINQELAEKSKKNLENAGIENVEIRYGSGLDAVNGIFDRILFSCAISPERFDQAKERLAQNGVLVAPVEENGGQIIKKYSDGETTEHEKVRFVGYKD